jgi:hypothetical protein
MNATQLVKLNRVLIVINPPVSGRRGMTLAYCNNEEDLVCRIYNFVTACFKGDFSRLPAPTQINMEISLFWVNSSLVSKTPDGKSYISLNGRAQPIIQAFKKEELCQVVSIVREVLDLFPKQELKLANTLLTDGLKKCDVIENRRPREIRVLGAYTNPDASLTATQILDYADCPLSRIADRKNIRVQKYSSGEDYTILDSGESMLVIEDFGINECSRLLTQFCSVQEAELHQKLLE